MAISICAGLLTGITFLLFNTYLPKGIWQVVSSPAVWLLVPWLAGRFSASPIRAVIAGLTSLVAVVVGFYLALLAFTGSTDYPSVERFWLVAAVVAGPVFAWFGYMYRRDSIIWRGISTGLVGCVFVAEAVLYNGPVSSVTGAIETALGAILILLLSRTPRQFFLSWATFRL